VDAYRAAVSKRDTRRYAERAIPEAIVRRVLEAGRLAGSSRNREPWRFVIVADPALRERLAGLVYRPANVRGAALVVSGRGPVAFDAGRAAQNMMLSARNDDVASCPNGAPDPAPVGELLGLGEDDRVAIVLSFGFPHRTRDPAARPTEAWAARADRRPLQEPVERLKAHPSRRAAATGRRARRVWCTGWSSGEARPDRFRIEDDRSDPRAPRR
jgi:nitroreductase